jgi:hypothetical protein
MSLRPLLEIDELGGAADVQGQLLARQRVHDDHVVTHPRQAPQLSDRGLVIVEVRDDDHEPAPLQDRRGATERLGDRRRAAGNERGELR